MSIHGWEHYELDKEMADANVAKLLEIYIREDQNYINKCCEHLDMSSLLSEEGKKKVMEQCQHYEEAKIKIALEIADRLTKTE
ncbi:hypothetical protein JOD82_001986 [Paenibacillus sp. 1182]|uniref:hypothetical protein n=1 Tax=Paenibacillus sp. 1182 TaxID=2806565 RepID=UPI001AE9BE56|nr:hypothetical protein [Paenibacillus sp. 1182]MBP1308966.1 hypothetical protein [Paenibacillus sp. 1182]